MASKNHSSTSKAKATSQETSLASNSITLGSGAKVKVITFTNVTDRKLTNPEGSDLKAVLVQSVPFTSATRHASNFTLFDYRSYCNVEAAAIHLSKSKEYKDQLQHKNLILKTSNSTNLVIVKELNESNLLNVVSFNKACAIMSSAILKYTFNAEFDWKKKEYIDTTVTEKIVVNPSYINRLAGQMGLTPADPYYWMIVPGYEFLYELYPAEVLAYTLVRLEYRKNLNIPDSMTDIDIISSLVMKMNRLHNLEFGCTFDDALKTIGIEHVNEAFNDLSKDIGATSKTKRNEEAIVKFRELISLFKH
ncbi:nucleocapsid protein p3 [pistacia virus B]|uniref:Nucleocapsid protein p3 n=1 Tax=pistacia virus B TaxID=2848035 RepID=A0A410JAN3_9VIRU|nr:nucleocapsid protein p3 [Pistacia emaravirus]QAR18004.1 nucleocapsid protein p3 [pistacia virus B]